MSYIPEYIRPVKSASSALPVAAVSTSTTMGKASPKELLNSDKMVCSLRGGQTKKHTTTVSRSNTCASLRYSKGQDETVCTRLSIKDRLKKLESEADVVLEVRNTSHYAQKRHSRSQLPVTFSSAKEIVQPDRTPPSPLSPDVMTCNDDTRENSNHISDSVHVTKHTPEKRPSSLFTSTNVPPEWECKSSCKRSQSLSPVPMKNVQSTKKIPNSSLDSSSCQAVTKVPSEVQLRETPHFNQKRSSLLLSWKVPSKKKMMKSCRRSQSLKLTSGFMRNIESTEKNYFEAEVNKKIPHSSSDEECITETKGDINVCSPSEADWKNVDPINSTVSNVATEFPVALRSPLSEQGNQTYKHDRRHARVFVMSSSDNDSDSSLNINISMLLHDNGTNMPTLGILNDPIERASSDKNNHSLLLKSIPPVKFVPSVLRSHSTTKQRNSVSKPVSDIYPELRETSTGCDERKARKNSPEQVKRGSTRRARKKHREKSSAQQWRSHSTNNRDDSSLKQEVAADAVKYGSTPDDTIPYIDYITSIEPDSDEASPFSLPIFANEEELAYKNNELQQSYSDDSILSPNVSNLTQKFRRSRASSVDKELTKGVHRRSYQIATCLEPSEVNIVTQAPKRQQHIQKLKNFFGESSPKVVQATEEHRHHKAPRNHDDDHRISRSGYLYFKVAGIEKRKRTSLQKSWKIVWAVLGDNLLYLCKDWNRNNNYQDSDLSMMASELVLEEENPLDINSCLVEIAYNCVKRRNSFRITTANGSEYLFQAENRDDMLAWITAIQKRSCGVVNENLILRKTNQIDGSKTEKKVDKKRSPKINKRSDLQSKDVDGSRRFKWRGGVNKLVKKFGAGQPIMLGGTFGVHLEDCPPSSINENVPFVVELCCRIVEERGLHFTGIYRVPGNSAALTSLQDHLDQHGVESIEAQDEKLQELNVVSSLLKSFLRKLPDPLFTNELYKDFIEASRNPSYKDRLFNLRQLVHRLPTPHYETLKHLVTHLRLVADNCHTNKMEVRNLAIIFGPTLVRSTAGDNMTTMVLDMSDQCLIIESIIQHADWFFQQGMAEKETITQLSPAKKDHEPVPSIEFLLDNVDRQPGDSSGNASDSSKSKCSYESEKDSFSRDVIELVFGKKWRQMRSHRDNQAIFQNIDDDDDGGFEDTELKKTWTTTFDDIKKQNTSSTQPAGVEISAASKSKIPNLKKSISSNDKLGSNEGNSVYQEHLERLPTTMLAPQHVTSHEGNQNFDYHSLHPSTSIKTFNQFKPQNALSHGNTNLGLRNENIIHTRQNQNITEAVPQYIHPPNPYIQMPQNEVISSLNTDSRCFSATPVENPKTTCHGSMPKCKYNGKDYTVSSASSTQSIIFQKNHKDMKLYESGPSLHIAQRSEENIVNPVFPITKNLLNEQKEQKYNEAKFCEQDSLRRWEGQFRPIHSTESTLSNYDLSTMQSNTKPKMKASGNFETFQQQLLQSPIVSTKELQQQKSGSKMIKQPLHTSQRLALSDENLFSRSDPKRIGIGATHMSGDIFQSIIPVTMKGSNTATSTQDCPFIKMYQSQPLL